MTNDDSIGGIGGDCAVMVDVDSTTKNMLMETSRYTIQTVVIPVLIKTQTPYTN